MSDQNEIEKAASDSWGSEVVRGPGGRWIVPPRGGRKPGPSQAELVRKLIEPARTELVEKALSLVRDEKVDPHAKIGALRLLLERLAPQPKHESERIEVPGMAEAPTFGAKCQAVIAAVAGGGISAEAGERALRLLDTFRKAVAHDELTVRIEALERGQRARTIDDEPGAELV